jgi:photosystem II stability/assembly factor-like uncharacterized protein
MHHSIRFRNVIVAVATAWATVACNDDGRRGTVQVSTLPTAPEPPAITTPWGAIGPAPPPVEAPVAVHAASGTIYVASFGGGVFKSTDDGKSFVAVNKGLSPLTVTAMGMAADDPNTVYASTFGGTTYKTIDGGGNWAATGEKSGGAPLFLLVDPNNANNVWVGFNGTAAIRRSTDGGTTWSNVSGLPATAQVFSLAIEPHDSRVLYAGSAGGGAFKSIDGGATWTSLSIEPVVWSVYVDPVESGTVWAGGNGNGVYRSSDAGATFVRVGVPGDGVVLTLARVGNVLYAGTASTGVWSSADGGAHWTSAIGTPGLVISMTADARGKVYAGTGLHGVLTLAPGGDTWTPMAGAALANCLCQNVYYVTVDPADPRHVALGTNDGGFIQTSNGGRTWTDATGFANRSPRAIAFDPKDPQRLYAGSFTGGGLFVSIDGGHNWQRRLFGPATIQVAGVAVDPADRAVYASTLQNAGVWKSTDLGATFTRIDVATPGGPFLNLAGRGIAIAATTPSTIYLAGATGTWRSPDAGATWTRVSTVAAQTVSVDPTDPRTVYIGTTSSGVLKSINGGTNFAAANVGLTTLAMSRSGPVQMHRSMPTTLFVGTEGGGVFKSTDAGASWVAVNGSLAELVVFGLAMDPNDPDTLYAATPQGVFKTITGAR